jgi:hypothetical protein
VHIEDCCGYLALNAGRADGKENDPDFAAGLYNTDSEIVEFPKRKRKMVEQARRLRATARQIKGEQEREWMEGVRTVVR